MFSKHEHFVVKKSRISFNNVIFIDEKRFYAID